MGIYALALCGKGFAFLMTALGSALVFAFRARVSARSNRMCLGFAGGVMCAASVFSLLLPAMERAAGAPVGTVLPGFALGAGLMAVLDALLDRRMAAASAGDRRRVLLVSAVTLHNIPEGMAVGLAFALAAQGEGLAGAAALALGVGIQNIPEGAAISLPLAQNGMSRLRSFGCGALSGAVEPAFGLLAVLLAGMMQPVLPGLMAFAAGTMMWAVLCEMVPEAGRQRDGSLLALLGFLIMMTLDIALG